MKGLVDDHVPMKRRQPEKRELPMAPRPPVRSGMDKRAPMLTFCNDMRMKCNRQNTPNELVAISDRCVANHNEGHMDPSFPFALTVDTYS